MLKMRLCFFEVGCMIEQVFNIAAFCFFVCFSLGENCCSIMGYRNV